jgi:hypothetical protein
MISRQRPSSCIPATYSDAVQPSTICGRGRASLSCCPADPRGRGVWATWCSSRSTGLRPRSLGRRRSSRLLIDPRTDPWAVGDRVAWGEADFPELDDVLAAFKPVDAPSQLIHGDLTGNVLFHDELPPAIIDFAPYWRPVEFASAIVVSDALCWHGAPADLADAVDRQYLLRALVYRAIASRGFGVEDVPEIELARRIVRCASR